MAWKGEDRRKPPVDSGNRLILEVPKGSNLDEVLRLLAKGSDSKQVLEAINNLTNLVKEKFMGLKEDNDTLTSTMSEVEAAVDAIAADVSALKTNSRKPTIGRTSILVHKSHVLKVSPHG